MKNIKIALIIFFAAHLLLISNAQSSQIDSAAPSSFDFFGSKPDPYNSLIWDKKDKSAWYEWWYYKVIDPQTNEPIYLCYGLVNPWDETQSLTSSRAYVSVGSFATQTIVAQEFAPKDFASESQTGTFSIGSENVLGPNFLRGHIKDSAGHDISWNLTTVKDWGYNAMGWTMEYKQLSDIFWYPAQASLHMTGWIDFDGRRIQLNQALGYQDRNWGHSFPKWWAWIASNDFENSPGTVLASGGGLPKLLKKYEVTEGYTLGLRHKEHEYIFRLPDADVFHMNIRFGHWEVEAINHRNEKVVLHAYAPREAFMILPFMTPQGRLFRDYEALNGDLEVDIYVRDNMFASWHQIDHLVSHHTGIEYGSHEAQDFKRMFSGFFELQK